MPSLPDLSLERTNGGIVAGIDEAGRGPWAGPVVAAAVIITHSNLLPGGIHDSKKLSEKKRESLHDLICQTTCYGIGIASVEEIDSLNIWGATKLAMQRAFNELTMAPCLALVDGKATLPLPCPMQPVIGGDSKSLSIAAASILAKVTRDRIMRELDAIYPHYGWKKNAGYGTAGHMQAIQTHGITPHHRLSFKPIRDYKEDNARTAA